MRDRQTWVQGIRQNDPNHRVEQLGQNGSANALRDGSGKLRDIEYKNGDVRFRSFEYDEAGNVRQMTLASKTKGVQIWNRRQDGAFYDQFGNRHSGDLRINQQTGGVTITEGNGSARTYMPEGRFVQGYGPQTAPQDGRQPQPPGRDSRPPVQPPYNGGDGRPPVQPPYNGGDRGVRPPVQPPGGDRQQPPVQPTDRPLQPNPRVEQMYGQFYGPQQITDKTNYRANLWDAAAARKPIVMTFYRSGDPQSEQVLRAVSQAKQASNGQADFMAVDLDKVDPNSPIGQYAKNYIGSRFGTPMTMVFTQSQGPERTPVVPDKPMHHQRGQCNPETLLQAIGQAVQVQQQRDIRVPQRDNRPDGGDRPPAPDNPRRGPTPEQMLQEIAKEPFEVERIHQLMNGLSAKDRIALMRDTCRLVDRPLAELAGRMQAFERDQQQNKPVDQAQLTQTRDALQRAGMLSNKAHSVMGRELLPEVMNNNNYNLAPIKDLMQGMTVQERFRAMGDVLQLSDTIANHPQLPAQQKGPAEKSAAKARAFMGLMCNDLGDEYDARSAAEANPQRKAELHRLAGQSHWRGIEWAMAAGHMDKDHYSSDAPQYQAWRQQILNSGMPGQSAEFLLAKGKENNNWFYPTQEQINTNRNAFQDAYAQAQQQIGGEMQKPRVRPRVQPQPEVRPVTPQPPQQPTDRPVTPQPPQPKPTDRPAVPAQPVQPSDRPVTPQPPQPQPPRSSWYDNMGDTPQPQSQPQPPVDPRLRPQPPQPVNPGGVGPGRRVRQ